MGAAVGLRVGTLLVVGEGTGVMVADGGDAAAVVEESVAQAAAAVASSASRLIVRKIRKYLQTNNR